MKRGGGAEITARLRFFLQCCKMHNVLLQRRFYVSHLMPHIQCSLALSKMASSLEKNFSNEPVGVATSRGENLAFSGFFRPGSDDRLA